MEKVKEQTSDWRFVMFIILLLIFGVLVVVVLLLVSASMGVIVKTVPQINVLVVGFPIKIAVGLITLGLSLVFFREILTSLMAGMEDQLGRILLAMK